MAEGHEYGWHHTNTPLLPLQHNLMEGTRMGRTWDATFEVMEVGG